MECNTDSFEMRVRLMPSDPVPLLSKTWRLRAVSEDCSSGFFTILLSFTIYSWKMEAFRMLIMHLFVSAFLFVPSC